MRYKLFCDFNAGAGFRVHIANRLVQDSRCPEGIVNILVGCTGALTKRRLHPKALWQPRVNTSNSLSDHLRPHYNTQIQRGVLR